MSFISSVRRALGFPGEFESEEYDEENDDLNDDDLVDDPDPAMESLIADSDSVIDLSPSSGTADSVTVADESEINALASDIFDSILAYFNEHQPEVVKQCIDIDAQRSLLIKESSSNLRERLEAMALKACRKGENLWAEKQQKMGAELMKLRSEYNSIRQQREEYQSAQLSAQRQKRAMTDRIRDLEAQVTTLEAEREQYQLENQSMARRLRSIDSGMPATPVVIPASSTEETDRLRKENESLHQEIDTLNAALTEVRAEAESLRNSISEATDNPESLNHEAELREIEQQISVLRDLKETAEARVVSLNKDLKASDATIAQLQKQLAESAKSAEAANEEIASLRSTIETNLYAHATAEAELRSRITSLEASLASPAPAPVPVSEATLPFGQQPEDENELKLSPAVPAKRKRKQRKTKAKEKEKAEHHVKISAIDELMDSTDWFVAPDPVPLKKDPEVEENFGYKEPARKNETKDDDRQLTLW